MGIFHQIISLMRLQGLRRRLSKASITLQKYGEIIKEQEETHIIEEVSP